LIDVLGFEDVVSGEGKHPTFKRVLDVDKCC